jgi:excisionase family DNA binding protein
VVAEQNEWIDVEATARLIDLHPNTIYRLVREGRLTALKFPVRIRRQDLDDLLDRCRIKPGELAHLNAYAKAQCSGQGPVLGSVSPAAK